MYFWPDEIDYERLAKEYYDSKVAEFVEENKTLQNVDVAFVGDSITDGYNLKYFYPEYITANRGISADTSFGLEDRIKVFVYDIKPKVVVLLIGINNITNCLDNYENVVKGIKDNLPNSKVILQSIYPLNGELADRNKHVINVNKEIKNYAMKYNYIYADVHSHLVDLASGELKENYTDDGIHPNLEGYKAITGVLKPIISKLV